MFQYFKRRHKVVGIAFGVLKSTGVIVAGMSIGPTKTKTPIPHEAYKNSMSSAKIQARPSTGAQQVEHSRRYVPIQKISIQNSYILFRDRRRIGLVQPIRSLCLQETAGRAQEILNLVMF